MSFLHKGVPEQGVMDICCRGDYSGVVTGSATLLHPEIYFHLWRLCHSQVCFLYASLPRAGQKPRPGPPPASAQTGLCTYTMKLPNTESGRKRSIRKSRTKIMTTDRFKKSWDVMLVIREGFVKKYKLFILETQFIISGNHLCT